MKEPRQYKKRILLAVSGLSPQILTETLYGLAINKGAAFIPTESHLITTVEGKHRARLDLLNEKEGKFYQLCKEYQLPEIDFSEKTYMSLPTIQLAFYLWLLDNTVAEQVSLEKPRPNATNKDYVEPFIKIYESISEEAKDTDKTHTALKDGMKSAFFSDKITYINDALIEHLGAHLARPYLIEKRKTRLTSEYFTRLQPEQFQQQAIKKTLILWGLLGGLGSRARRGFGLNR